MSKEQTPAEALHERFRAELKKPVSERFFPEDDLVSVFDTAGDSFDDYLREEALLLGARLYPDSVPLIERRAIHYLDTDKNLFVQFMQDYSGYKSRILNILRFALLEEESHDFIVGEVEKFLSGYRFEEDEEIIQFVQILHDLGLDDWLVANLDRLRKIVPYLPSLLYEYAVNADESDALAEIATGVLEELTDIEPYVSDYWTMLALAHLRNENTDEAASAIEYALAIDPDDYQALKTRFHIANITGNKAMVNETIDRLLALSPDDAEMASLAVLTYDTEKPEELFAFLDRLAPAARTGRTVMLYAIAADYPDLAGMLSNLYDSGVRSAEDWRGMADFAYDSHNLPAVALIFNVYEQKTGEDLNHDYLMLRTLFDMGNYEVAVKLYTEAEPGGTLREAGNLYTGFSIFLISLLRLGDAATAREAAKSLLGMIADQSSDMVGSQMERMAMKHYLEDILRRINSKRITDWNKISPLSK